MTEDKTYADDMRSINVDGIVDIKNSCSTNMEALPLSKYVDASHEDNNSEKKLGDKVLSADPRVEHAARARQLGVTNGKNK